MAFYPNGNYLAALSDVTFQEEISNTRTSNLVLILTVILLVFNMLNIIWSEYLKEISMLRLIGSRKRDIRFIHGNISIFATCCNRNSYRSYSWNWYNRNSVNILKDSTLEIAKVKPKIHINSGVMIKQL